jgi:hypothetical protein
VRTAVILALAVVTAAVLLLRVPSIVEPLGIDQGLFASGARAISRGYVLYRDVWDQKPPAIFLTYLAAFNTFGWTPSAIGWLDLIASAGTSALLFAILRRLDGGVMGAVAAALYAALTMPGWLYRNGGILERSVAETFISLFVAFAAWSATFLVAGGDETTRSGRAALSPIGSVLAAAGVGLGAGVAIAYKPNAGVYLPALLAWVAIFARDRRRIMTVVIMSVIVATLPALLTLSWLSSQGVWTDARVALFDFNRFYVAQDLSLRAFAVELAKAFWLRLKTDPLWAAGGIGGVVGLVAVMRSPRRHPEPALAILWGGAAACVIALNGARLFNTYFIQAFPPLAVAGAWILSTARQSTANLAISAAAAGVMAVPLASRHYLTKVIEVAQVDSSQWRAGADRSAYLERFGGYATGRGYSARALAEVADYVHARSAPDDLIYQFGINSAGVYFAADRMMAQRFLRVNEFVPSTFPAAGFDLASVVAELETRKPLYLIFETLHTGTPMANAVDALPRAPELQPLLTAYEHEVQIEDYSLYKRR